MSRLIDPQTLPREHPVASGTVQQESCAHFGPRSNRTLTDNHTGLYCEVQQRPIELAPNNLATGLRVRLNTGFI